MSEPSKNDLFATHEQVDLDATIRRFEQQAESYYDAWRRTIGRLEALREQREMGAVLLVPRRADVQKSANSSAPGE